MLERKDIMKIFCILAAYHFLAFYWKDCGSNKQRGKKSKSYPKPNYANLETTNLKKQKLEKPDSSSTFSDDFKIIVFTDISFSNLTQIWYTQMNSLGYETHEIYAFDQLAFDLFSSQLDSKGQKYRISKCEAFEQVNAEFAKKQRKPSKPEILSKAEYLARSNISESKNKPTPIPNDKFDLNKIWQYRIQTILTLLKNGHNILLTDVDSVFCQKFNVATQCNINFDMCLAEGTSFPKPTFQKLGFTLHFGFAAIRSTPASIKFFEITHVRCQEGKIFDRQLPDDPRALICDDQSSVNYLISVYPRGYRMNKDSFELANNAEFERWPDKIARNWLHYNQTIQEELGTKLAEKAGYFLKLKIWNKNFIRRSRDMGDLICEKTENSAVWVLNPILNLRRVSFKITAMSVFRKYLGEQTNFLIDKILNDSGPEYVIAEDADQNLGDIINSIRYLDENKKPRAIQLVRGQGYSRFLGDRNPLPQIFCNFLLPSSQTT